MTISTSVSPYWDDYDETKQFYEILFRPSYAVQARELNQMQSILQKQIQRSGQHFFTEGAMVIPGQLAFDTNSAYVKLLPFYNGADVSLYVNELLADGVEIVGQTTGIRARVSFIEPATATDSLTIYIKYTTSDTSTGLLKTFLPGESLFSNETIPRAFTIDTALNNAIGVGASANIQTGVYFVNGRFVLVPTQTITLDKYTNTPNYLIGLSVVETFVVPETDSSLLDNASGSTNYAAPGAHRYKVDLVLTKTTIGDTTNKNFIQLGSLSNGVLTKLINKTDYSELEKTLARRTYDEAGNYTVTDFNIQLREHRSNNMGAWAANTQYLVRDIVLVGTQYYSAENSGLSGSIAPAHTIGVLPNGGVNFLAENSPQFNNGVFTAANGGVATSIAVGLDPGKAYVFGYEIEKLATNYVTTPKARDYQKIQSGIIQTSIGNTVRVTNVFGALDVTSFLTVSFYDTYTATTGSSSGTLIGSAKARYIGYDSGTVGSSTAVYDLSLFDISINTGRVLENDVRQIYLSNGASANFTADVVKNFTILSGAITLTSGSTTLTGLGTKFTTDLLPGRVIRVNNSGIDVIVKVLSIQTDSTLTLVTAPTVSLTNTSYYLTLSSIIDSSNTSLMYSVPNKYVRNLRNYNTDAASNTAYYTKQKFSATVANGVATITTILGSETFANPLLADAFIVTNTTTGAVLAQTTTLNVLLNVATISVATANNGNTVFVIAIVRRILKERTKTMVRAFLEELTTQTIVQQNTIQLANVDGQRLRKVSYFINTSTGLPIAFGTAVPTSGVTEIDITNRYVLSGNQKDSHYDFSTITLNPGLAFPTSPIRVYYDYYSQSATGDYFSADSYSANADNIPTYTKKNGVVLALRDIIDFRPTKLSATTFSSTVLPALGFDIIADYSFYLGRIDKMNIRSTGIFVRTPGISAIIPKEPDTPESSMLLYILTLLPYTESVNQNTINITRINNRRYTMRDIGDIDARLANVEYYTSLNLLEQQTKNLQLFDTNGNLNFKNGFLVDPLTGQNIADTKSKDFSCAIDPLNQNMRPGFSSANVNLVEKVSTLIERTTANYALTGGLVTLPFTEVAEITQGFGTRLESVTPFIQLNFLGNVVLNPTSDDWYETAYAPDIVVNAEGTFNAVVDQYRAELGTVWNAWETIWSSVSSVSSSSDSAPVYQLQTDTSNTYIPVVTTTVNTTNTTTSGQVATGRNVYVKEVFDTKVVGDGIIAVDLIPYMRSISVLFTATGLKGVSQVNPFFDGVNVTSYVVPANIINFTGLTGTFDTNTNSGAQADNAARSSTATNNTNACLNVGDVIHNGTAGLLSAATATGIAVLTEDGLVRIVNMIGTFTVGQTIYGSISKATAIVSSVVINTQLITNGYGEISGIFTIPSSSQLKFRTGSKSFVLTDSTTNGKDYTTLATSAFVATGYVQTRQQTILSTRNGVVSSQTVSQSQVISSSSTSTSSFATQVGAGINTFAYNGDFGGGYDNGDGSMGGYGGDTGGALGGDDGGDGGGDGGGGDDPIAESFSVLNVTGIFMTSLDVYFGTKDRTLPVFLELREMLNGIPTTNVVPGSRKTLRARDVNLSLDGSVATRFTFDYPVYLQGKTDYAFVLLSDSTYYQVFVSRLGENDLITGQRVSVQPALGSLFKSQNGSVWQPEQLEDIKFTINRALFNTQVSGNVTFVNQKNDTALLRPSAIYTKLGINKIRIYSPNHGHIVNSKVTISGATGSYNGIPLTEINGQKTVIASDFDTFVIATITSPTDTGYVGDATVYITKNIRLDVANLNSTQIVFPSTTLKYFITTTGTDFVKKPAALSIAVNNNFQFRNQNIVLSTENETTNIGLGLKSLEVAAQLVSIDPYLSPVIDINRFSLIAVGNRIGTGYPLVNIAGLDDTAVVTSNTISFSGSTITTTAAQASLLRVKPGRLLTMTGATNSGNNITALVSSVAVDGSSISFVSGTSFTTETNAIPITAPVQNSASTSTSGGSLIAGTYYYVITATNAIGETIKSNEVSITTTGTTSSNSINWTSVTNATGYKVYRGTAAGAESVYYVISSGSTVTYVDTNATSTIGTPPSSNSTGGATVTIVMAEKYIDEIIPEAGISDAKYIMKKMSLLTPAKGFKAFFDLNMKSGCAVDFYYRNAPVGSAGTALDNALWTLISPVVPLGVFDNNTNFFGAQYVFAGTVLFDRLQIKLVLRSGDTSAVPIVRQIRLIAVS